MNLSKSIELPTERRTAKPGALARYEARWGLLLISPWLIGFVIFQLGPILASLYLSFTRYDVITPPRWAGIENYKYMVQGDPLFFQSLWVTVSYVLILVPLEIIGSLLCAMLLNRPLHFRAFFRSLFFIPSITPVVAVVFLFSWLLNGHYGLINYLLSLLNIQGPQWLGDPRWAKTSLILLALWASIGGARMIIFLAGLQGVPQHLYDAAKIDGANALRRFFHVTVPMLTPTVFFNLILAIIGSFQVFAVAYVATSGGPRHSTYFYLLHLYFQAFRYFEMGYASALAWVLFFILLAFTYVQFRLSSRWVYYEGDV